MKLNELNIPGICIVCLFVFQAANERTTQETRVHTGKPFIKILNIGVNVESNEKPVDASVSHTNVQNDQRRDEAIDYKINHLDIDFELDDVKIDTNKNGRSLGTVKARTPYPTVIKQLHDSETKEDVHNTLEKLKEVVKSDKITETGAKTPIVQGVPRKGVSRHHGHSKTGQTGNSKHKHEHPKTRTKSGESARDKLAQRYNGYNVSEIFRFLEFFEDSEVDLGKTQDAQTAAANLRHPLKDTKLPQHESTSSSSTTTNNGNKDETKDSKQPTHQHLKDVSKANKENRDDVQISTPSKSDHVSKGKSKNATHLTTPKSLLKSTKQIPAKSIKAIKEDTKPNGEDIKQESHNPDATLESQLLLSNVHAPKDVDRKPAAQADRWTRTGLDQVAGVARLVRRPNDVRTIRQTLFHVFKIQLSNYYSYSPVLTSIHKQCFVNLS